MPALKTKILHCPRCQGKGCSQCQNAGVFLKIPTRFFYWKPTREDHYLLSQQVHFTLNNFFDYLAIFLGVAGLLYQSVVFIFDGMRITPVVWVGILALCFVFFRVERRQERQQKLVPKILSGREVKTENIGSIVAAHNVLLDAEKFLDRESRIALIQAWRQAGHTLEPFYLFNVLLENRDLGWLLRRLGIPLSAVQKKWRKLTKDYSPKRDGSFQVIFKEAILESVGFTLKLHAETVGPLELFLGIVKVEPQLLAIFEDFDLDLRALYFTAEWVYNKKQWQQQWRRFIARARFKPGGVMNRAYTSRATPALDRISDDLTVQAKAGALPLLINREREMEEILINLRQKDGNVILSGPPGVGKTAMVFGLANLMASEDVPEILQDKRLLALDAGALVSGDNPTALLKKVISEIAKSGNIILFIDNISNLAGLGEQQTGIDAAEVVMQVLPLPTIHVIGSAIPEDYTRILENRGDFLRRFQTIRIEEPDSELALEILESRVGLIEYEEKIFFTFPALDAAVTLAQRYLYDTYLPAKALNLLKDAASYAHKQGDMRVVLREDVVRLIEEQLKIPISQISREEGEKLLHLEQLMHKRIINQEEGVKMVAEALRRARAGMRSEKRPISSLLFVGPTGVGKTETAKTLAEIYFGSEDEMIRLDMTEYKTPEDMRKLIGPPPAAGAAATGGYFTDAVRKKPFSLILLDELEKAHRDVRQAFLQVIEDGRLTDAKGRTINFSSTIIIATSNAGTPEITEVIRQGKSLRDFKKKFIETVLAQHYGLEFLNRFDGIVLFRPLEPEHVRKIAKLMLAKVAKRLEEKKIRFAYTDEAVVELAQKGFDPVFGARPLRRVIQDTVDNALAKFILSGELGPRDVAVLEARGKISVKQATEI